ncbi:NUMOD1 domain-containing DNA-binding protein [Mesobacillus subterraneus]|uniref:NUMOD1 domain-containing DNA-binding protein n=1 Tax=Mesobacillus subterraneus TaxID=285983 RepID=UPI001CFE9E65|nr:NUMOD1 domain-containing DNA-binding protein [Mesobacillus subterraneus]WLR53779.1 NUMOD1 domain-containing DNA-binding protein [Mesobacillus subterraneus]
MNAKKHPLYRRWWAMMERCYKPNYATYKYYGGRDIIVHERWHNFWNFVEDVDNHLLNGHLLYKGREWQLDKDSKGGNIYSLENCVVISAEENRKLQYEKQEREIVAYNENEEIHFKSVSEASRTLGIERQTINHCLKYSWKNKKTNYRFKYVD